MSLRVKDDANKDWWSRQSWLGSEDNIEVTMRELESWSTQDGDLVRRILMESHLGVRVTVMSWGASLTGLSLEDGTDIVLGYSTMEEYWNKDTPAFGAAVGGATYRSNSVKIEGQGWEHRNWDVEVETGGKVVFTLLSSVGDQEFPVSVLASVTYTLRGNRLDVNVKAMTTSPVPLNLVHRLCYNLGGHGAGYTQLYKHSLRTWSSWYSSKSPASLRSVTNTSLDFRDSVMLGQVLPFVRESEDIISEAGYDHIPAVSISPSVRGRRVALMEYKDRRLTVYSNMPGLRIHTANYLPREGIPGKDGANYTFHGALCLEPQNLPDTVHNPDFLLMLDYSGLVRSTTIG